MPADTTATPKVWPVKHSPLLRAPERFVSRAEIRELIQRLTTNLVSIEDTTGEFLLRLDDGRVIDTKGWAGWEWTHGVGLYGIWQYYNQTGDQAMRDIIDSWFAARLAEGTTKNVNTMAPFLTLACRYEETGDRTMVPWLDTWAEWAMRDMPRTPHGGMQHVTLAEENHHQLWDDTLMMTVLPLTKIGLVLDRPHYVREATFQFLTHVTYLMDRETGLWFHGWSFDGHHHFAKARWARGNSWVTMVIPDFLELRGPAGRRSGAPVPDPGARRPGRDARATAGRVGVVAHAARRPDVLPGGLGDRRDRLRNPQGGPQGLSRCPLRRDGGEGGQGDRRERLR